MMVTAFWALILISSGGNDLSLTGEGHFSTEAECEKAAEPWHSKTAITGVIPACVATR
jgi:hypothetical protein